MKIRIPFQIEFHFIVFFEGRVESLLEIDLTDADRQICLLKGLENTQIPYIEPIKKFT
jgi:hypothetical protein